jgi:tyrosyl-tRNA synthetase
MRKMMTVETIDHNVECIKKQMSRFLDFSDDKAIIVNNGDWLRDMNFMEFMREVGVHFNVANMLRARAYENRMAREGGLTFFEMSYMLLQAYDFYMLYQKYGCNMEFGGDDQWSNMLAGTDLIRKKLGKDDAYAMTITLLLNSEGKKMGKTGKGAVWLDPDKTSPYDFYQYWRNVGDADVDKCLRMLTFLPLEQIDEMKAWDDSRINEEKEILAYDLTKLVHGEDEARKAQAGAKVLFAGGGDDITSVPASPLKEEDFRDGKIDILQVLVSAGLCPTRSDARRNVQQGGVTVKEEKVTDISTSYDKDFFKGDGVMVKRGKKAFKRVTF